MNSSANPPPNDLRRRLRELLSVPERDRSDEQWDEIVELEIQLAPGNRIGPAPGGGGGGGGGGSGGQAAGPGGNAGQGQNPGGNRKHRPRSNNRRPKPPKQPV
jgi:hypothetical protein